MLPSFGCVGWVGPRVLLFRVVGAVKRGGNLSFGSLPAFSSFCVERTTGRQLLRLSVAAWTWALLPRLSPIGRLSRVPHPSWVVDCTLTLGLSKVLYCSIAYVQCCVVVGVVAVSACQTVEPCAVLVPCVHVPAMIALLARVGRVNHYCPDAVLCGFVCCELLQLGERPLVEHVAARFAGLGAFCCLAADVCQVLERDGADVRGVRQLF